MIKRTSLLFCFLLLSSALFCMPNRDESKLPVERVDIDEPVMQTSDDTNVDNPYAVEDILLDSKTTDNVVFDVEEDNKVVAKSLIDNLTTDLALKYLYRVNGADIVLVKDIENATIEYVLYNQKFNSKGKGVLNVDTPLYCPYGTEVCVWVRYANGIKTKAEVISVQPKKDYPVMNIVSPRPGIWKSRQVLRVDCESSTDVFYSVDGSDPLKSGLMYTEPVLLDLNKTVHLRVKAVTIDGRSVEEVIDYSVSRKGKIFMEPNSYTTENKKQVKAVFVPYRVLNWYFVDFDFQMPVYYEISKVADIPDSFNDIHKEFSSPVFIDRKEDYYLFWSCKSFENGKIQVIPLPAKPALSGQPNVVSVNNSILLSFSDNRYNYCFEYSDLYEPKKPTLSSFKFDGVSKKFDVLPNEERNFKLRIGAFFDGVLHGEFYSQFKIDKLPPPSPDIKYSTTDSYSGKPVKVILPEHSDEYDFYVDINPPAVKKNNRALILTGRSEGNVDYTVKSYYQDDAGNKSMVEKQEFTIGRYSIYVDALNGVKNSDGTKKTPFLSVKDAVKYIQDFAGKEKQPDILPVWTVFLRGEFKINTPLLITNNIKLEGNGKSKLKFMGNVGFVAENCVLKIENCKIVRYEHPDEPREVPIIYASNSDVSLESVQIESKNGGAVINLFNSHIDSSNSTIKSDQKNKCSILNMTDSSAIISNTDMYAKGNSTVGISAVKSVAEINSLKCLLTPECVSRAIESWNSKITVSKMDCERLPKNSFNFDTCIWYDSDSQLKLERSLNISGFKYDVRQQ